jgi:LCP family protein required for cell wall assembly
LNVDPRRGERAHRSPSAAAILSFLLPGLGHWYVRRPRGAVLYGLPVVGAALVLAWRLLVDGPARLAIDLFAPSLSQTALILIFLLGLWRLIAMADAFTIAGGGRAWRSPGTAGLFAALALVVVLVHGVIGFYTWSFYDAGETIFVSSNPDNQPVPSVTSSDIADELTATPVATPQTANSRINVLLTGIDSSEGRNHALNDTLIVVSVDPVSKAATMISFPRDIARFPLWDGRTFNGKINSLMTYASLHPKEFPDGSINTLVKELGYLLGVPIHYYAAINLDGFVQMVDLVGGVTIDNPQLINDPSYGGWGPGHSLGFYLTPGKHHLDGQNALAYVRSRKTAGDNDFNRARRQQQVLVALERKMADPAMIARAPSLLHAAKNTIRTSFPSDRLGEMLDLAGAIEDGSIVQRVLGPPYAIHPPTSTTGGVYILKLDLAKLAQLSVTLFGSDSRYYKATAGGAQPWASPSP